MVTEIFIDELERAYLELIAHGWRPAVAEGVAIEQAYEAAKRWHRDHLTQLELPMEPPL